MPQQRRTEERRSRLTVRRVDPVTVLRFSVVLYLCLYGMVVVASVVLWLAFSASGVRGNVEDFVGELIQAQDFTFQASQMLRAAAVGGVVLVGAGTVANVVLAVLFNLISDVMGGITLGVEEPTTPVHAVAPVAEEEPRRPGPEAARAEEPLPPGAPSLPRLRRAGHR